MQEALATSQEVRRALRDQKVQQNTWKGKGKGKSKSKFPSPFRGNRRRVHVDLVNLRTKCARCGQVGHWAKECAGTPDAYARNRSTGDKEPVDLAGETESAQSLWCDGNHSRMPLVTSGGFVRQEPSTSFCGIQTDSHHGVVDTAARGAVGLDRGKCPAPVVSKPLKEHHLQGYRTGKSAQVWVDRHKWLG